MLTSFHVGQDDSILKLKYNSIYNKVVGMVTLPNDNRMSDIDHCLSMSTKIILYCNYFLTYWKSQEMCFDQKTNVERF